MQRGGTEMHEVDVVIIGVNSRKTLEKCIESIYKTEYDIEKINIIYSDGGSTDNSLEIASKYEKVKVLNLNLASPTPGKQRNEGWKAGVAPFVQFIDSDTILDSNWIAEAVKTLTEKNVDAVCGNRNEMHPEESVFNWLGNLEWNPAYGVVDAFGGDVMIKRSVLEKTDGYNPELVAGEDPELAYRIRKEGFTILRLDTPMTLHDLGMKHIKQYWKRAFRTGYAYIEVFLMNREMWSADVKRICVRGSAFILSGISLLLSLQNPTYLISFILFLAIAFRPRLLLVNYFMTNMKLNRDEAKKYAWHTSLVVLPQYIGIIRFLIGKFFNKPLKNKIKKLKTGGV